jgi:hypothetical protein
MKKTIDILKIVLKYAVFIYAGIEIVQFAVKRLKEAKGEIEDESEITKDVAHEDISEQPQGSGFEEQ